MLPSAPLQIILTAIGVLAAAVVGLTVLEKFGHRITSRLPRHLNLTDDDEIEPPATRECGSYRLESLLGRGGMGEVWRARHRLLARPAAVKIIQSEASVGTPAYMAPEQVVGGRAVDARTDIYAVGCVAYWLLTGERVFETDDSRQAMLDHVSTRPTPPSQRAELAIPEPLEVIVLACLEKDPDRRPQTMDALSEALLRALTRCETERAWTEARAHRWWDTHLPRTERHSHSPVALSFPAPLVE